MAIVKHIKSKNANYTDAINYLFYQHDEKAKTLLLNEYGQPMLREEFYADGLNCTAETFDLDCFRTNRAFNKNRLPGEIKSHHYIISYDPRDASDCDLTGKKAQELSLEVAQKMFPGHQALVVTHTDGENHSGNIHTHIVINSVRAYETKKEDYMTQASDFKAGGKHRSTNKFMEHFKKEVMAMCEREGLHQIDLLSPSPKKVTEAEFRAKSRGQEKMDKINKKITAEGLRPSATTFQTQKDFLRKAIEDCSRKAQDFEEFQSLLLENYNISVISQRGRYRYLHPDRSQRITEKALGTDYGRDHLEELFSRNEKGIRAEKEAAAYHSPETDYRRDPLAIFYYRTQLRLVVDLQRNVKAMQSEAYAQKVKITNLQQMANTLIYIQEHGYDTRKDLSAVTSKAQEKLTEAYDKKRELTEKMKVLNSQIHYTGQYFASKNIYAEFLKSENKKNFRNMYVSEITAYEEARDWLKDFYPDGKMLSLKSLKERKRKLQGSIDSQKTVIHNYKNHCKELETVSANVDAILRRQAMETEIIHPRITEHQKPQKERKEESL
ncbi:relaxase/mobilization nuclease domain-containing protein [Mediterraneibacter glycyrrhizinilyticus]|uniref:relaxase/mobilization nuclease domain-containing protein n=1 Tax=Mediterraneibacter glycyrrhizinilyticus TaxID=342942 RepID=UPI00265A9A7E|nr:relaxase/mobilization nuclease domain-containing protein [Mediterraneibacter glycyrrhizinilyticus]